MLNINNDIVKNLINTQYPQFADLQIMKVKNGGNDNYTFHLGNEMSVRLPSNYCYAKQVEKELKWLPYLSKSITLDLQTPLAKGIPNDEYPLYWSINKWIDGETVTSNNIKSKSDFAFDLAQFLKELQSINVLDGPVAGEHNFHRGGNLQVYDYQVIEALEQLSDRVDVKLIQEIWTLALASKWEQDPVWVHGDIAINNLLVKNKKLSAVIDFGILGVGDPACDYAIAWTFLDDIARTIFFKTINADEATINRARGWVLWKALITYQSCSDSIDIIDEIITEFISKKQN